MHVLPQVSPVSPVLPALIKIALRRRATRGIRAMGGSKVDPLCVEIPVYSTSRLLASAEVMIAGSGEDKCEFRKPLALGIQELEFRKLHAVGGPLRAVDAEAVVLE